MEKGFVYILTNDSFRENIVKIGRSKYHPEQRAKGLYTTSVPTPFDVYASIQTERYVEVENLVHHLFDLISDKRINKSREYFFIDPKVALKILKDIKDVIGDEAVIEEPEFSDDEKRGSRKSVFTFSKKGIQIGCEITFIDDNSIKAIVHNNRQVIYEGKVYSLSGLTKELYTRMNRVSNSGSYQGPHYFTYKGVKLNELENVLNEE